jgi:hypothetical protein
LLFLKDGRVDEGKREDRSYEEKLQAEFFYMGEAPSVDETGRLGQHEADEYTRRLARHEFGGSSAAVAPQVSYSQPYADVRHAPVDYSATNEMTAATASFSGMGMTEPVNTWNNTFSDPGYGYYPPDPSYYPLVASTHGSQGHQEWDGFYGATPSSGARTDGGPVSGLDRPRAATDVYRGYESSASGMRSQNIPDNSLDQWDTRRRESSTERHLYGSGLYGSGASHGQGRSK